MTGRGSLGERLAGGIARWALLLYPAGFRREAGADLVADYRARAAERAASGIGTLVAWLLASTTILIGNAAAAWRDEARGSSPSLADVRATARALVRAPAFALTVVVTLALGLAANFVAFALFNGVLMRPLPYGDADTLVTIWSQWTDAPKTWVSAQEYALYTQQAGSLADAAAYFLTEANVSDPGDPTRLQVAGATPNVLSVLQVEPVLGRSFSWDEARDGSAVVLISYRLWQERFAGAAQVIGQQITAGSDRQTIIGVLPAGFRLPASLQTGATADLLFPYFVDLAAPVQMPRAGGDHGLMVIGRVSAPGGSEQVRSEVNGIAERLKADGVYPEDWRFEVLVVPLVEDVLGPARRGLQVLLATGWFVALIACANVANLLLARAEHRELEVGVRAALGASRGTLLRLVLTESAVLGSIAGAIALGAASIATGAFIAANPWDLARVESIAIDARTVLYSIVVTAVAVLGASALPAIRLSRASLLGAAGRTRVGTGGGGRIQGLLVAVQAALAVVLLIGTALMVRSVASLGRVDPGFVAASVYGAQISVPPDAYPDRDSVIAYLDQFLAAVDDLPEVEATSAIRVVPLATPIGTTGARVVDAADPAAGRGQAEFQIVAPGYFATMRIPVVRGRTFTADDGSDSDGLVINEAMSEQFWGARESLEQRVMFMGEETTVIGVVGNVAHNGLLAAPRPTAYRLHRQLPDGWIDATRNMSLVVRSDRSLSDVAAALRRVAPAQAPSLPPPSVLSMEELQSAAFAQQRFVATALGLAGLVALVLSAVGLYGVLAYSVSRSQREIGIRLALGAERRDLVASVVRRGVMLVAAGTLAGCALSLLVTRILSGLLHGVSPHDPPTYALIAVGFAAVAAFASWIPARRASRVDPVRILD